MILWHRGKATVNRLTGNAPPKTRRTRESTFRLPYEIVEMITAHLTSDLATLKACSLTCRSWYALVLPRIHHTLLLGEEETKTHRDNLRQLSRLHKLGLAPLVKEILVKQGDWDENWLLPRTFKNHDLRYFSAFNNVHTLKIQRLDNRNFMPNIKRYFEQFSQSLRSIALFSPWYIQPQELSYFLSLFPNLDDINITCFRPLIYPYFDSDLVPFSAPKLRGDLTLRASSSIEIWSYLIAACGGLRFRYMELYRVGDCAHTLLEECAGTLETLKFHVADCQGPYLVQRGFIDGLKLARTSDLSSSSSNLNLSRLKVLRSLEVGDWNIPFQDADACRVIMDVFSTIKSPVFSELVVVLRSDLFTRFLLDPMSFDVLRTMYKVRPFKLVFLLHIYSPPNGGEWMFERAFAPAFKRGLFNFLDSPPVVRSAKIPIVGGKLGLDWVDRPIHY